MTGTIHFPRTAFIGFDHIFNELERISSHAKDSYPPHNVVKYTDKKYAVELAVSGFGLEDLAIEIKDNGLFEKKQIQWIPLSQLRSTSSTKASETSNIQLREHYKTILKSILKNEEFIMRLMTQN